MGFFSSLFGQAKELTKLGNSVANVKNMLDQFESDPDNTFLLCSAWICKVGIIDLIENNSSLKYEITAKWLYVASQRVL